MIGGGTPEVENTRLEGCTVEFVGKVLWGVAWAALRVRLWWIGEGEGEGGPFIAGNGGVEGCDGVDLIESRFFRVWVLVSRSECVDWGSRRKENCIPCSLRRLTWLGVFFPERMVLHSVGGSVVALNRWTKRALDGTTCSYSVSIWNGSSDVE